MVGNEQFVCKIYTEILVATNQVKKLAATKGSGEEERGGLVFRKLLRPSVRSSNLILEKYNRNLFSPSLLVDQITSLSQFGEHRKCLYTHGDEVNAYM